MEKNNVFVELYDQIKKLQQNVISGNASSASNLEQLLKLISNLPIDAIAKELDSATKTLSTLSTEVTSLQSVGDKTSTLVNSLTTNVQQLSKQSTDLTNQLATTSSKIDSLGTSMQSQITSLQKDTLANIATVNTNVSNMSTQLATFQKQAQTSLDTLTTTVNAILKVVKPVSSLIP
ncbi:ORF118 protein [Operophtera brumata nucleopolyhedrovirus]|uniref:ORF118 protein n=1 Tax=Operophtera brumata nucleopolyhedrovirus TaxID=1046267 RepID=A0A2H4V002_9ABAC|nr:ORF118 protein [Operophtera brumata nucleopolyhedrovirus]AUA60349.1 ORF118 protein [Operophtera brumata nucleopolyhedrovirus]